MSSWRRKRNKRKYLLIAKMKARKENQNRTEQRKHMVRRETNTQFQHHMYEMCVDQTPQLKGRGCKTGPSKDKAATCCFKEMHFKHKDVHRLNAEGWMVQKKLDSMKTLRERNCCDYFRTRPSTIWARSVGGNEGHFIMIKESSQQQNIIVSLHVSHK